MAALQVLNQLAQFIQTFMVGRKALRPDQPHPPQHRQGTGVQCALLPLNSAALTLVQTGQLGFRKNDSAQQVVDKVRTTTVQHRQGLCLDIQRIAQRLGFGLCLSFYVGGAGEVEAAQRAGALITVTGKSTVDKDAQALAKGPQPVREICFQLCGNVITQRGDVAVLFRCRS